MREVFIKYNPYRVETTIMIDGMAPKQNSRLNFYDRHLQEWIEDLPDILFDECSSRNFKITFHGTVLDYEDVESMASEAEKKGFNFEVEHIPAEEVADKEAAITEIFNEIQAGPFDELKQPDVIKAFNMAKSSDFEVSVVATMSAGKSTLINALLGQKLMPSKQEACTATITEIKDNDADHFSAEVYDSNGELIESYPELSLEIMEKLNNDPEVSKIRVEGDIPFVTAEDVSLVLVDTPGPNNSRDPEHKKATYRMLSESSKAVVLYILNATQLAVNDDCNLLSYVAKSMKVGGKQSRDRFIFVINKLDQFRKGEDSVESAINKVKNYLHDNEIDNANIYPASALAALDIRTILKAEKIDEDDNVYDANGRVNRLNHHPEMHFETIAPLTPSARREIEARLADAEANDDKNEQALIHSGIVSIEMAIKMYVQKYAKTAKIKNIVDTFSKRLESAQSFETTKKNITENQDKEQEIIKNIETIEKKLKNGEDAKQFKERINKINYDKEIEKMANGVILEAQKKITAQLSAGEDKMSKREAEELCRQFARFADNLQAEVQVKLEELITNHVHRNAEGLLDEYKKKIAELAQDLNVGSVCIDPFELMEGEINGLNNIESVISDSETTEEEWEVVGNHREYKEIFGLRRWINDTFGTSINVDYDVVDDYDWVEHTYIDGTILSQRFFAPIQEQLYKNSSSAVQYAKKQEGKIKQEFYKKFDELNGVLNKKMQELKLCTTDKENIKKRISESEKKLEWLKNIQCRINAILDIE